ncbi:MAG: hypothetical protein LC799_12400 [Actinobacteria bacterium]|nr:hypothetical protein [Actinomycetota bacterium]
MNPAEATCEMFMQTWAEEVRRQVARVRQLREKLDTQMDPVEHGAALGQCEFEGHGSPAPEQLEATSRWLWVAQHQVVWSAHQLERWSRRLAVERGDTPSPRDQVWPTCAMRLNILMRPSSKTRLSAPLAPTTEIARCTRYLGLSCSSALTTVASYLGSSTRPTLSSARSQ